MEGEITYNNDFQKTDNIFEDLKWILVTMSECEKTKKKLTINLGNIRPKFNLTSKSVKLAFIIQIILTVFVFFITLDPSHVRGNFTNFIFSIMFTMPVFVFIIIVFLIRNYVKDRSYKISVEEQKQIDNINDKLKIIEQIEKDQQNNLNLIQYPMNYRGKLDIANVIAYYDNRRADTLKEALNLLESDKQHQELMKVQKNMLVTINNLDQKITLMAKDVKKIKRTTKVGATFTILDYIKK